MTVADDGAWAAKRVLIVEMGAPPALVAKASRVGVTTLLRRAQKEGWPMRANARPDRARRVMRIHDRLLDKIEKGPLMDESALDKAQMAELSGAIRTLSKIAEAVRDDEAAKEEQVERDADIADVLARLDARIVELAHHFAEGLAEERVRRAADPRG